MASAAALARLRKEFKRLQLSPVESIEAVPCEENLLEWHYLISGPKGSSFEGGFYHGKLIFPPQYPYKPPAILMLTPNGRFKTNTRLCLSMSDFHPETWNPLWSVSSILAGLLSFMLESTPTYGSIESSDEIKRALAKKSAAFNLKDAKFRSLFTNHVENMEKAEKIEEKAGESTNNATVDGDSVEMKNSLEGKGEAAKGQENEKLIKRKTGKIPSSTNNETINNITTGSSNPSSFSDSVDRLLIIVALVTLGFLYLHYLL